MIHLFEFFAGIGTQYQACKDVFGKDNVCSVGISEIDLRPLKAYKALHGEYQNFGDITKIEDIPPADIWTYSFPCTDLSIAGKQEGLTGQHSSLLYEVYRILCKTQHKPQYLIMENVKNLVSKNFIAGFNDWCKLLEGQGYATYWQVLKACEYGGGTVRERVFAVSVLNNTYPYEFLAAPGTSKTLRDFLEPADKTFYVDEGWEDNSSPNYHKAIKLCDYGNGGQGNRIYSIAGQGITLTSTGGGKGGSSGLYLRPEGIYKLSGIEMAKVMGWSAEQSRIIANVLSNREVGFVMGNAIDLNVMRAVMRNLQF